MDYVIIGVVLFFAVLFIWLIISHFKKRSTQWTGTVIDKGYTERVQTTGSRRGGLKIGGTAISHGGGQHVSLNYYIVVKIDGEKELRWSISEGLYQRISIGDKLSKDSGTMIPRVVEAMRNAPQDTTSPAQ